MNNDLINEQELAAWLAEHKDWQVKDSGGVPALYRHILLTDFSCAMHLANQIAVLAEQQDHHPQLQLAWGWLDVLWWSHDVKGISRRDLNLAVMTDRALLELKRRIHAA